MSIELTQKAAERVREQLSQRGAGIGLRVGVRKSGCSGYMYTMDYADELDPDDEVYEQHGARLVINRKHLPMLEGSTLDFKQEGLNRMFRFDNPRAQNSCGCGESFNLVS
ncbi:iron-sulfur cluster assembly accessory protein [Spectribacter hydrogenoxidans]|uniref:Iron-sulfur cluster assembly accessory protein n=1 Tax=Spectribacter hydrogenoxidans TaxID=3075608 RepID=A0ABU3BYI8_9GAMM|nr:iron-sulfur cluster assembly accessory protein [Salinisphaera sp. W335]MDT0634367.1 iron-sulfur cluster assembly accessory protein [Salinisphaera sp. W335]